MFFKKKSEERHIDTSIDGFKYVGINLTEKQYEDLTDLNMLMISERRKYIPVFNMMMLLKILGLLPPEMVNKESGNSGDNYSDGNFNDSFQCKFGRYRD